MEELLLSQMDKENRRLNALGDILISLKPDASDLHMNVYFLNLTLEFETLTDSFNHVFSSILNCAGNKNLLKVCVDFVNALSFMIAAYSVKLELMKEEDTWRDF